MIQLAFGIYKHPHDNAMCYPPYACFQGRSSCLAGETVVLDGQEAVSSAIQGNGGLCYSVSTLACATSAQRRHRALAFAETGLLHLTQLYEPLGWVWVCVQCL